MPESNAFPPRLGPGAISRPRPLPPTIGQVNQLKIEAHDLIVREIKRFKRDSEKFPHASSDYDLRIRAAFRNIMVIVGE